MKLILLLPTLVFVNIHYIRGNGIRIPVSIYDLGLKRSSRAYEEDHGLYGTISIGTPPQKINVLFRTTIINTWRIDNAIWVLSSFCKSSVCSDQIHNTYNHKNSTTFRGEDDFDTKIQKEYYVEATDTITIGNFPIQNVLFRVTTWVGDYNNKPYYGIVELNHGSEFLKLCEKLGLKKKFSFYTNYPWDNNTSELMLCGEDKTKFQGNLQYLTRATDYTGWTIDIQSVMLHRNHENVPKMEFRNAILTISFRFSSSYIFGPEDGVKKIYDNMLHTRASKIRDDLKEVDCNKIHALPSITFRTADINFTLTGNDYIKQMTQNDERVCIVPLLSDSRYYWDIGSIFFRKFYTVFDAETPHRIGFAESVHPSPPAQIMICLF